MKAQLFPDFMISMFLWLILIGILLGAFFLQLKDISGQLQSLGEEKNAIFLSEGLFANCAEDFGIIRCVEVKLASSEISAGGLDLLKKTDLRLLAAHYTSKNSTDVYLGMISLSGNVLWEIPSGTHSGQGACVGRLALFEKEPVIFRVCVR